MKVWFPPSRSNSDAAADLGTRQTQLKHATEQMQSAVRQMSGSMELMNRSMRQMQHLQQRIEVLEAQPPLPPTPSTTWLPSIHTVIHTPSQSSPTTADAAQDQQDQPLTKTFASFAESTEHRGQDRELFGEGVGELQWPL